MRIIAGQYKSYRLATVRSETRPTSDRLREILFDVLGVMVRNSLWLDPFAGSGAVGLEALSRGAQLVIFNDKDPETVRLLKTNLGICGVAKQRYDLYDQDVFAFMRNRTFPGLDFVFLDPPYRFRQYAKLIARLDQNPSVHGKTVVILELFKKTKLDFLGTAWEVSRNLQAGHSRLIWLRKTERNSESVAESTM